jgi:RNA recognition motif-containing protein
LRIEWGGLFTVAVSDCSRAEFEIYIGNYPVRFHEEDLKDLFKENNIEVKTIRLKHDGQKV